jgi:hypothetical protein
MKDAGSDPIRWRDLPPGAHPDDRRAAALVRSIGEPFMPGPAAMEAIRARVELRRGPRRVAALRRLTWVVVAGALVLGMTLGAAAHSWLSGRSALPARPTPARGLAPAPQRRATALAPARAEPAVALAAPAQAVAAPKTPAPPPARRAARRDPVVAAAAPAVVAPEPEPSLAPLVAAPVAEDAVVSESRAVGLALRRLRQDHDARGALDALDRYRASFPNGGLGPEANLVRVEALLALDERVAALRLLDGLAVDGSPGSRQLLVLRGELRAAAGRCSEAAADLGGALSAAPRDAVDARALFARASCFSRLGQYAAARGDLEAYVARFPRAPHAAEATRALRELP